MNKYINKNIFLFTIVILAWIVLIIFINREKNLNSEIESLINKLVSSCQVKGIYQYHNGGRGLYLVDDKTIELKSKSVVDLREITSSIPEKCGSIRVDMVE